MRGRDAWRGRQPRTVIVEDTKEAMERHGYGYGAELCRLDDVQLQALRDGKLVAVDLSDGDYVLYLAYEQSKREV